jgi:uncharacterized protein YqgV (UPF0045/DUF77 family)
LASVRAEFSVFPFREGTAPPPHAQAAIDAVRAAGLDVEIGPFGTAVSGEVRTVLEALCRAEQAAVAAGASRVVVNLTVEGAMPDSVPHVGRALEQLIAAAEGRVGRPVAEMSRAEKQQVVRFLDQRGAFELKRAVETVADVLGVSRFTVYNYLEAIRGSDETV